MTRMSVRATYAMDEQTDQNIRRLAKMWHVSQAEIVRRSVRVLVDQASDTLSPADVVAHYQNEPIPRSKAEARRAIKALRNSRHSDDERRTVDGS